MDTLLVQVSATSLLGGKEFVASGIVNDAGDALALVLECHGNAEEGKAVGKVGGAVERVDVPAVVAAGVQQAAFLAEDIVRRPVLAQALANEGFGFAVGDGDQVGLALVFDGYVAMEILHEQGAGLAGNLRGGRNNVGPGGGSHPLLTLASVFRDV